MNLLKVLFLLSTLLCNYKQIYSTETKAVISQKDLCLQFINKLVGEDQRYIQLLQSIGAISINNQAQVDFDESMILQIMKNTQFDNSNGITINYLPNANSNKHNPFGHSESMRKEESYARQISTNSNRVFLRKYGHLITFEPVNYPESSSQPIINETVLSQQKMNEKQQLLAEINFADFENVELEDIDLKLLCKFSDQADDLFAINYINKYGFTTTSQKDIFFAFTNFKFYKLKVYTDKLKTLPQFKKYMLAFDEKLKADHDFKNQILKNDKFALKFIQEEAQKIKDNENKQLTELLKLSNPLSNNLQALHAQLQEIKNIQKTLG